MDRDGSVNGGLKRGFKVIFKTSLNVTVCCLSGLKLVAAALQRVAGNLIGTTFSWNAMLGRDLYDQLLK